jgi:hypothetical protein
MEKVIAPLTDDELRTMAIKRLKAKREFQGHLLAYVTFNLLLVSIWFVTSQGFFWPVFLILGWGIGLVMHAWDVYSPVATPDQVAAEMDRLRTSHEVER